MSAPGRRLTLGLAWVSAALACVGVAALLATAGSFAGADAHGPGLLSFVFTIAAFSVVGGVISLRRPGNPIGRLLALVGLGFAIVVASSAVSEWVLDTESLPVAVGDWIAVLGFAWVPSLGLIGTQLPLRLPDGDLPSPRWRWFSRATVVLIVVATVAVAVQPFEPSGTGLRSPENPLEVESLQWLAFVLLLVLISFVVSLVALIARYRRTDARERAQLRWIALGGAGFLSIYIVTLILGDILARDGEAAASKAVEAGSQMAFAILPVTIGYAILRHRLYDIGVVVNRALVYSALTATLAAVYLGSVLVIGLALGRSGLSVAASTLAVAALFGPARRRIQSGVDRRFYRHRYDAARTLEAFGGRLRDDIDLDSLQADLRDAVRSTVRPSHVSLWLREAP